MAAGRLGRVNQLPALADGGGGGYFDGDVLAGAEGGYGHSGVAVPLRTNIHEVHVVAPAHRLPRLLADFDVGNGATGGLKLAVGLSKTFRVEVSHDADFRTVYVGIAAECFQTALPYADEPDTYDGQRRAG